MAQPPTVATGPASALGTTAMTVNGIVHPHGLHATYKVEYGATTAYGSATEEAALPPRLGAYYHESWEDGFAGWGNFFQCETEHRGDGKASRGYIRYTEQSLVNDFNHEATGVLHLITGFYTGNRWALIRSHEEVKGDEPASNLGGGDADLRGARLSLWLRGNGWRPNGSELVCWVQSQSNAEVHHSAGWRRANWGYNGHYLTDYLVDGEWHKVELTLSNDAQAWSYGGNNPAQQQEHAARYAYWPLDSTLGHNNINFLLVLAYVDPQDPPTGSVDFDELLITYRNRSLVFPGNGGRLVAWPVDSADDPATLTDGWRNGPGRVWRSVENPTAPQEFVFAFDTSVDIESLQVHNNPDWPGKNVEVLVSEDGHSYERVGTYVLPEKGEPSDNFAFVQAEGISTAARFLRVRLISGYRERHLGLGEIEVFGTGARMPTDDAPYSVNIDVDGLDPGQTFHYRLVATGDEGTSYGDDRQFTSPATLRPLAETGDASRVTETTAKLEGRLNPLGAPTYFFFEYGTDTDYSDTPFNVDGLARRHQTQPSERINLPVPGTYAGTQVTPRTVLLNLEGLRPGTTYHYRVVAVSQHGISYGDDATFTTQG